METFDKGDARAIIEDINSWEIESLLPRADIANAWNVVIGSTPRIVGDLLPGYEEGEGDGLVFPLQAVDGTAEFDEIVQLRRAPDTNEGASVPGIAMWGRLTCAFESRDGGLFIGTIAFYEDEAEGSDLMVRASIDVTRLTVERALQEVDASIVLLEGNGAFVVPHADRILAQIARLNALLADGIAQQKAAT